MKHYRLNRLFSRQSNRCFDVAVDHGFFNQPGFLMGIEDMRTVVKTLVDAAPDAIQLTLGIGGLFIGPSDLAFSLGVPLGDPAVETAIETIVAAAKEAKIPLGTLCGGNEVEKRLAQGFQFLAVGSDGGVSGSVQDAVKKGRAFKAK